MTSVNVIITPTGERLGDVKVDRDFEADYLDYVHEECGGSFASAIPYDEWVQMESRRNKNAQYLDRQGFLSKEILRQWPGGKS